MKDARLCCYDAKLKCWVEEQYKTRWEAKRDSYSNNVGMAHQVFDSKDHAPCIALYATPTSLPMFIADIGNTESVLNLNDSIWGYKKDKNGLVAPADKTAPVWIHSDSLQHIPFRMVFDLNDPENADVRENVNIILTEMPQTLQDRYYERRINLSLDQIELIGLPDRFFDLFMNLRSLGGDSESCTALEEKFTAGYDEWIHGGYRD